jgi:hypothetical protein
VTPRSPPSGELLWAKRRPPLCSWSTLVVVRGELPARALGASWAKAPSARVVILAKSLKKISKLKKDASRSDTKYWILMYRLN